MKTPVRTISVAMSILLLACMAASAQPVHVTNVPANSSHFKAVGNLVYFAVGSELWRTDGTADGTFSLMSGIDGHSMGFFVPFYFKNMFFFRAGKHAEDGKFVWRELWRTDGTAEGTILLKTSSTISIAGTTEQYLYFAASDAETGRELHRTDGTISGTSLVKDINPGTASGFHGSAAAVGNELFFRGDDGIHGEELWKSNGFSSETIMIKDLNPGAGDGYVRRQGFSAGLTSENYFATADRFYFTGYTPETGNEPWTSDGTEAGTVILEDTKPGADGQGFILYNIYDQGVLYFIVKPPYELWDNHDAYADLWRTEGSPLSTTKIKTLDYASSTFDDPARILGNKILFFSRGGDGGPHMLWVSDGTSSGTQAIFNLQDYVGSELLLFTDIVNNHLLFYGDHDGIPTPFFRSDGTSEGTVEFTRFASAAYLIYPRDVTKVADFVFYADHDGPADNGYAQNPDDHYQLIQTDGFTTQSVRTISGTSLMGSDNIVDFNGRVLFTTYDDTYGSTDTEMKLWIYDPADSPANLGSFTLVNADTDEDLRPLKEGDVVIKPEGTNISIRFNPAETPGSVVFKLNDATVRTESAPPYALAGDTNGDYNAWKGAVSGTYKLTATPYSETGGKGTAGESLTINFTIREDEDEPLACTASGTILREYWDNVEGNHVSAIPIGTTPTSTNQLTIFEGPTNIDTNYGTRIRGYICAPATGNYIFWIASNDHSELWLSTDDTPASKKRIAYVSGATGSRQWDKYATQKSAPVALTAGTKYYVEALHKQGVGTDNIAVGWQLPDGAMERPIPGGRLSPYSGEGNHSPMVLIEYPYDGETFNQPANIIIEARASDHDGNLSKVEFFEGSNKLGEDMTHPYTFTWSDVPAGTYTLTARAVDDAEASAISHPVMVTVNEGFGECRASGTITREYWSGVPGNAVSDIPTHTEPTSTNELTIFEGPSNIGTNYGTRIRGFICPPVSGGYNFWIASNDHSELWLSTDDNPLNKRRIAYITGATGPREWDRYRSQLSETTILLEAGRSYYIEALHKQGVGTDHVAVGWQLPDGTMERPIPGNRLSPFEINSASIASETQSTASQDDALYSQLAIYPNPLHSGEAELTVSGYEGIDHMVETQVEVINITGDVVFSEQIRCGGNCSDYFMKINKQLVPGVYVVNLKTNGFRYLKRLLVK